MRARPVRLVHRSGGYVLDVEPAAVDVHRFRALVERAGDPAGTDQHRVRLLPEGRHRGVRPGVVKPCKQLQLGNAARCQEPSRPQLV